MATNPNAPPEAIPRHRQTEDSPPPFVPDRTLTDREALPRDIADDDVRHRPSETPDHKMTVTVPGPDADPARPKQKPGDAA